MKDETYLFSVVCDRVSYGGSDRKGETEKASAAHGGEGQCELEMTAMNSDD